MSKVYCYTCKFLIDSPKGECIGSRRRKEDDWLAPKGTPFTHIEWAYDKNANNDCPDYRCAGER